MASLLTDDDRSRLLANGRARAAAPDTNPQPVVRLFTPDAHATWLLAWLDPADGDTAHGVVDLGIGMPSLGSVRISDLDSIVGPRQRPVMRDRCAASRRTCAWPRRTARSSIDPRGRGGRLRLFRSGS